MKIAIITSWFPTKSGPHIAPFVYDFAKYLGNYGVDVSVITPMEQGDEPVSKHDHMTIYRISSKLTILSIFSLTRKIKPDVIHVHAPTLFSSNAIIVAKIMRVPIVATVHRGELEQPTKPLLSLLRKLALGRFQKIIAVSYFSKSLALKAGAPENKLTVIYNSCDEARFSVRDKLMARNVLNLSQDKPIILFVGNLISRKGIVTLVDSLRILRTRFVPDFLAIIIGRGEEQKNIESKINQYELSENIKLYGWCPEKELAYFYNAADAFVLPSTMEGHSIALLEAMASGLPIVASDVEGNRESVDDGVNGLLFETGNEKMLAEKLAAILNDTGLHRQMSRNNPMKYSEKFSISTQMKSYLGIYESLIRSTKRKS